MSLRPLRTVATLAVISAFRLPLLGCSAAPPAEAPTPVTTPQGETAEAVETASPAAEPAPTAPPEPKPTPQVATALAPIPQALRRDLDGIAPDPAPPQVTRGRHYVTSNESQHHLLKRALTDLGGIQIGVGAEQNYVFAGWSRPEVLVLLDFDQWIVDLNRIYGMFFREAKTPEEFLAAWEFKKRKPTLEKIRARWPKRSDQLRLTKVYDYARADVEARLKKLAARFPGRGAPMFLNDAKQYDHVAKLWRTDRVLCIRGDLTKSSAVQGVARVAKAHGLQVGLLYLSNTQDYFDYEHGAFKTNMLALPYAERGVVLHTKPRDRDYYRYITQTGANYQAWLRSGKVKSIKELAKHWRAASDQPEHKDWMTIDAQPSG